MMHVKVTGLLAVAAAAMMALAGPASADYVTTTTGGEPQTPTIHAVNEGGHVTLKSGSVTISCSSTVEGGVDSHGGEGVPVAGEIDHLTFTGCTNFWHVTTEAEGSLALEHTSGHNGTLSATGTKVRTTRLGVNCVYETNNTHIGTLTGGNPATLHIEASIPIVASESAEICGTTSTWEGNYVTTGALYEGVNWS